MHGNVEQWFVGIERYGFSKIVAGGELLGNGGGVGEFRAESVYSNEVEEKERRGDG